MTPTNRDVPRFVAVMALHAAKYERHGRELPL